jgi:hypothetical protein
MIFAAAAAAAAAVLTDVTLLAKAPTEQIH